MLSEKDIALLKILQKDLPLEERPFLKLAKENGYTEEEILLSLRRYLKRGFIRRYAAVLKHNRSGYLYNAMVVWDVPEEVADKYGLSLANLNYITHCYLRQKANNWPYNLYAMVHARDEEEFKNRLKEVCHIVGNYPYKVLTTKREFKKTSFTL